MKKLDPQVVFAPARPNLEKSPTQPSQLSANKIKDRHRDRLAGVYVRQSDPQQVIHNRESRERQYELTDHAVALGWSTDRIVIFDEDQGRTGRTASHRGDFHQLLAEVTMDHVGIIVGLEMSRIARSGKDWHHLLELCAIFGTLLADFDGIYDPNDPNDRLLLGLKGTMSEMELHTMRNRLEMGRLHKAERGDLIFPLPIGYVRSPTDDVILEPDQQAQNVVRLIFEKFEEFGTVGVVFRYLLRHGVKIPVRPHDGPNPGVLTWRRPNKTTLNGMIRNPTYAGTYAYGRCPVDAKRRAAEQSLRARKWVPRDQWKVTIHNRFPAYITWDRFLKNQATLRRNKSRWDSSGAPRQGAALLGGILACGCCGNRLGVYYSKTGRPRYGCTHAYRAGLDKVCQSMAAPWVDGLVVRQVLRALEPAALELSLQAGDDIQKERERLDKLRQQELQRARYEAQRAERHYRSVDPENRLVAATLEKTWDEALCKVRQSEEDYDRFQLEIPQNLTDAERDQIQSLAADVPGLWNAPETTAADRKIIIRLLIDKVVVTSQGATENIDVAIHWKGGFVSCHAVVRRLQQYDRLRDFDQILERVFALHEAGKTARQIADQLQKEQFPTIRPDKPWTKTTVNALLARRILKPGRAEHVELASDEWHLSDLVRELGIRPHQFRSWIHQGFVHCRRSPLRRYYIVWTDASERERLRNLRDFATAHPGLKASAYPKELITPKQRKAEREKATVC